MEVRPPNIGLFYPASDWFRSLAQERGPRARLMKLLANFRERSKTHVGAQVAAESTYEGLLKHYRSAQVIFLTTPKDRPLPHDIFNSIFKRMEASERVSIQDSFSFGETAANCSDLVLFEPRAIFPELVDYRDVYLKQRVPIIFRHHSISYREHLREVFLPLLLSNTSHADSILCSSNGAKTAISNILGMICEACALPSNQYKGRLDVIPFGIDTDKFSPRPRQESRRLFGLPLEGFILLYFGRVSHADKADLLPLLYAFRTIREKVPNSLLVIAGTPRDARTDLLAKEIALRRLGIGVKHIKYIADDEKAYLYSAADLLLAPADSIQESFGLAIIEAMACGLPQIVSDWNGYRDLVAHGVTGFRAETLWGSCDQKISTAGLFGSTSFLEDHLQLGQSVAVDMDSVVRWVEALGKNPELLTSMRQASRARAISEYSMPSVISKMGALFRELKDQAQQTPWKPRDTLPYRIPRYYESFSNYASSTLSRSGRVIANIPRSRDVLGFPFPYAQDDWGPYSSRLAAREEIIRMAGKTPEGISISDILHLVSPKLSTEESIKLLLWLIKYGCLEYHAFVPCSPLRESKQDSESLD